MPTVKFYNPFLPWAAYCPNQANKILDKREAQNTNHNWSAGQLIAKEAERSNQNRISMDRKDS